MLNKINKAILIIAVVLVHFSCQERTSPDSIINEIPKVTGINLDGKLDDWTDQGLEMDIAANNSGDIDTGDFAAHVRLGWNREGIYLGCRVKDDTVTTSGTGIFDNDVLEIFISSSPASNNMIQYIIPAGLIDNDTCRRIDKYDYRTSSPVKYTRDIFVSQRINPGSYLLEVFLPFKKIEIPVSPGNEFGMQLVFTDTDNRNRRNRTIFSWHYYHNTYLNNNALQRIKLVGASTGNSVYPLNVRVNLVDDRYYDFNVIADDRQHGKEISMSYDDRNLYAGELKSESGFALTHFEIYAGEIKNRTGIFKIHLDGALRYQVNAGEVNFVFKDLARTIPERFENDIRLYEYRRAINPPTEESVLFLGSSSIRMWATLEKDFPGYDAVKCGYGGSRTADILYFFDRVVRPYNYKTIVLFCGINDINAGIPADTIVHNVQGFIDKTREYEPSAHILLLSNTVSVSKRLNYNKIVSLNDRYRELARKYDQVEYVDVFTPLLNQDGSIRPELYSADSTHMNPPGYKIWTGIIEKSLAGLNDFVKPGPD